MWGCLLEGREVSSHCSARNLHLFQILSWGERMGQSSFQPTVSLDPKSTNPALSGAGMGMVSLRPGAAAVLAPALGNRQQGSGQFWEEAVVNHLGCSASEAWPGAQS